MNSPYLFFKFLPYPNDQKSTQFTFKYKRMLLPTLLLVLITFEPTREITVTTLSDAFWAVSAYVASTLLIYHYLSAWISKTNKLTTLYHGSRNYQVLFASLLGALPGCGGAIIVTTQFISGRVGFGAMVAVLTSTMGDAAFLLLASTPSVGFSVVLVGIVVGAVSGWMVNQLHTDNFLRPDEGETKAHQSITTPLSANSDNSINEMQQSAINLQGYFWKLLIVPVVIVALLGSFQVEVNNLFALPDLTIEWVGCVFIITCLFLWALTKEIHDYQSVVSEDNEIANAHPLQKAAQVTNFVSAWVVVAFLIFEMSIHFSAIDLPLLFSGLGIWMPFVGVLVGLLPGCGPQILVTSLYISGAVPLSAQLSNSISNDGDALFPAIALVPKAALVATFYSAIPAFVVGYGYHWFFE
ncbi:hypothetical protein CW745_09395 [Psychromonas sp. psych-6C06]|uniref:putative manganese transporter n=1 Tax=Psychromonas sp. psych-6C06 TaxID=2058089 RepID=UPI000C31E815|nr:putative manganese transporter [Psychromonas sp. psych-6C06]PKF61539.1 hypothetical protein CW745_09395 [Psychromonas sp. psych-6C06]